eukprot:1160469-Pelagomonas_calceolata.AAC.1
MGIRKVTGSMPCLISVMRVERSFLMSTSGSSKFICVLDRMSMELQSNLEGFVGFKSRLLKGLQSVRGVHGPAFLNAGS